MTDTDLQQKRLIAAAIDFAVVVVVAIAIAIGQVVMGLIMRNMSLGVLHHVLSGAVGFVGSVVVLGFILCRDVVAGDRSLGKKFQDIRVTDTAGRAIGMMDSVKRNLIFAIGSILGTLSAAIGMVPCLGAMANCLLLPLVLLGCLVGLVAAVVEVVKIVQEPAGIRFGDGFAGTRVVR